MEGGIRYRHTPRTRLPEPGQPLYFERVDAIGEVLWTQDFGVSYEDHQGARRVRFSVA